MFDEVSMSMMEIKEADPYKVGDLGSCKYYELWRNDMWADNYDEIMYGKD